MRIYVAGPMRGMPDGNTPAFTRAAAALRGQDHEVFSPAEQNTADGYDWTGTTHSESEMAEMGFDLRRSLAIDLGWICAEAEGVVVLPGWYKSRGSRAEVATAQALDIPVWRFGQFVLTGADAPRVLSLHPVLALEHQ